MNVDPERELLQACDERGDPTDCVTRASVHSGTFKLHMAVHVVVERPGGAFILQKRTASKRIQPGKWDTSVGGHVLCGEDVFQAALREIEEELGISGVRPVEAYRYLWASEVEREFVTTYHLQWSGEVVFPKEEIEEVREWRPEEIEAAPPAIFTPNFLHEYNRFHIWKQKH